MSRFQDGDRVIVPNGSWYLPYEANLVKESFLHATIRTNRTYMDSYAVVFDLYVGGHDCSPLKGIEDGHGWWVPKEDADREFEPEQNDIEEIPYDEFCSILG